MVPCPQSTLGTSVGSLNAGITMTLGSEAIDRSPTREAGAFYLRDLPARGDAASAAFGRYVTARAAPMN